jgi:tRNA (guanine37-N1)-methyltransferase
MRIDIITILPQLLESFFSHSILKRAAGKGLIEINTINLRDYTTDKHHRADDYQYGGSSGMVLMIEPIANCITQLKQQRDYDEIIYLTPDGEQFDQGMANRLSLKKNIVLLCGHYKGVDQRVRDHFITMELSIGDYVLSGGEIAAAAVADAICRLVPGALNDETSALFDSYQDKLLAPPVYTRPEDYNGWKVPPILLSGDPKNIGEWQMEQSLKKTLEKRPDLLGDE